MIVDSGVGQLCWAPAASSLRQSYANSGEVEATAGAQPPPLCSADFLDIVVLAFGPPPLAQALARMALERRYCQLSHRLCLLQKLILGLERAHYAVQLFVIFFAHKASVPTKPVRRCLDVNLVCAFRDSCTSGRGRGVTRGSLEMQRERACLEP